MESEDLLLKILKLGWAFRRGQPPMLIHQGGSRRRSVSHWAGVGRDVRAEREVQEGSALEKVVGVK